MDVSSLTDDQIKIAVKVIDAAKKHGVNPDFALAVAFAESGFDPNAKSPKGALGPMQLMPDTAKGLGVDPTDVDENIEGGVRHLKAISSNPKIGKDPLRVLAAYNAGETRAREFFDKDDVDLMPDETVGYIAKIANLSGGDLPPVLSEQPVEEDAGNQFGTSGQSAAADNVGREKTAAEKRGEAQLLGGAGGATIGVAKYPVFAISKGAYGLASKILGRAPISQEEIIQAVTAAAGKPQSAPSQTVAPAPPAKKSTEPLKAGDKWGSKIGGPGGETVTEAAGHYRTQRDLPADVAAKFRVNRSGVLLPLDVNNPISLPEDQRMQRAAEATKERISQQTAAIKNQMAEAQNEAASWNRPRPAAPLSPLRRGAGRVGTAALNVLGSVPFRLGAAGASAAGNLQDFQTAREAGDTTGQAIAATGGLGAVASLVPKIGPLGATVAGGADVARRAREGDYTGAAVSGGATLAPYLARAALGAELGPLGSVATMTAPMMYDAIRYKAELDAKRLEEAMKTAEGMKNYWLTRGAME